MRSTRLCRLLVAALLGWPLAGTLVCARPAHAVEPTAPGLSDLVVYDSGAHERGLPAVRFEPSEHGLQVDIPPAVHVHRYYYSGDKEIQGPIIQGGPTIIVANHPKTGERMYIDAVLPAGAPRIAYDGNSITYVYTDKRVCIKFQHFPFNPCVAVVKHHGGQGIGRSVHDFHQKVTAHTQQHYTQSPLVQSCKDTTSSAGKLVHGAFIATGGATARVLDGLRANADRLPGAVPLKSATDQAAERAKSAEVRKAARQKVDEELEFVRTNR